MIFLIINWKSKPRCTRCFFPLGVSSTSNQKVCSFTIYAVFIFIYSFTHFYFCIHRLTEVMNAKAAIRSEYARLEAPSYALGKRARRGTLQKAASIVTAGSTQALSRVLQKSVPKKAAKTRMKGPPGSVARKLLHSSLLPRLLPSMMLPKPSHPRQVLTTLRSQQPGAEMLHQCL